MTKGIESSDNEKKLKILCLHGYRQNGDTFRNKLGSLRKTTAKYAEYIFITAPNKAILLESDGELDSEQRSWWANKEDGTFKGTNKNGPAYGYQESLRLVEDVWEKQGPFHGLLGFSQGACFTGLICGLAVRGLTVIRPKFAILASGFVSGSLVHKSCYEEIISIPSLHVYGLADEIIPKEMSQELSNMFGKIELSEHSGGHYFPASAQQRPIYIKFLQEQLKHYLENEVKSDVSKDTFSSAPSTSAD